LWQALGFSLLFKANDILQGPSANNFQYKLMISRMSDQKAVLREIMETIDDSDNYIVRELNPEPIDCDWLCGLCGHNLNDLKFLHLGGVEADDGKVVTGFKFIQHPNETNRLAISIKQGELKEMGVIGEQDWKEPGEGDSQQFYGSGLDTIHEADWTFHQADPGRTIVGIKFCVEDVRVGFCIKTKKVNFASGQLGSADDWSDAVKKSGDDGLLQWDGEKWKNTDKGSYKLYKNSYTVVAEAEVVEANPPAMLTGVGLFGKEGCNSLKKKHLVIRANDIFEFDETSLKSCDGEHSDYSKEESDTVGCCGEYMYDSSSQRCIEDEYGVKEPHYISIPDCGDTPTNSENKMECADGEKVEVDVTSEVWEDNWDACFKRQSHIVRCPFPYIPCEDMWERKMDFKCGINCASKGGKRQTCNGDMKCFAEPRKDGLAKQPRCADGETYIPAAWTSCQNKGSVRIQCPQNHYPCSTLTGSAELPEFKCSTTCADSVRAQQCQEVRCVAEPRDDDKLLCADENTGAKWKGCVNRGSVRIQCPKNTYPCNNMNSNNEFVCSSDCTKHGGKRTTCYADSNGDD